jgi:hypothetical protein
VGWREIFEAVLARAPNHSLKSTKPDLLNHPLASSAAKAKSKPRSQADWAFHRLE